MKYTEEIIKEIEKNIRLGLSHKDSAELSGITERTFYKWMKKVNFFSRIKKAELEGKRRLIGLVVKAADIDWRAAMTFLERRYPEEFAQRYKWKGELTGEEGGPIKVKEELSDEEIEKRIIGIIKRIRELGLTEGNK